MKSARQIDMMKRVNDVADEAYDNGDKADGLAMSNYRKAQFTFAHELRRAVANFERAMVEA